MTGVPDEGDRSAAVDRVRQAICDRTGAPSAEAAFAAESGHVRLALLRVLQVIADLPEELISSEIHSFDDFLEWIDARPEGISGFLARCDIDDAGSNTRVRLRAVVPTDFDAIYAASVNPKSGFRWRFNGATPSPETVAQSLWQSTLCQFIVEGVVDRSRYGLVTAYDADFSNGFASLGLLRLSDRKPRGETFEGLFHIIEYLFATWNFRKLYFEVPGFNEAQLVGLDQEIAIEEGRFRDHLYWNNKWWDMITLALYREQWETFASLWRPYI